MTNKESVQKIKSLAHENGDEIISIRHHIHSYPELSFQEIETAAFERIDTYTAKIKES